MTKAHLPEHWPQHLSELAHDIYLLIDQQPMPTDLEEIEAIAHRSSGRRPADGTELPEPPVTRLEVEQAVAELERFGYVETILRPSGELFRLTPWAKAAAASGYLLYHWELLDWRAKHRRGQASEDSRPERSEMRVCLPRSSIGPSFDDLVVDHFGLPLRVATTLTRLGVGTVGQLAAMTAEDLRGLRNIGPKSIAAIEAALESVGLELGRGIPSAEACGGAQEDRCPGWDDRPNLYQVFSRSGGFFDETVEYKRERVMWTGPLMEIAGALDRLLAEPGPGLEHSRLLRLALETFIVLVEPRWWLDHSPPRLSAEEDERWLRLLGGRDFTGSEGEMMCNALAAGREATWEALEDLTTAAAETFVRARDPVGLAGCAQVVRAASKAEAHDG